MNHGLLARNGHRGSSALRQSLQLYETTLVIQVTPQRHLFPPKAVLVCNIVPCSIRANTFPHTEPRARQAAPASPVAVPDPGSIFVDIKGHFWHPKIHWMSASVWYFSIISEFLKLRWRLGKLQMLHNFYSNAVSSSDCCNLVLAILNGWVEKSFSSKYFEQHHISFSAANFGTSTQTCCELSCHMKASVFPRI